MYLSRKSLPEKVSKQVLLFSPENIYTYIRAACLGGKRKTKRFSTWHASKSTPSYSRAKPSHSPGAGEYNDYVIIRGRRR